jgi:hypothetical protein
MISLIVYGRNDAHGYNLHKRGALSLNALSEVLTAPSDELIFVDYNTPDELPTFPEAIADTLTDRCKSRLRILRVRPDYHARFAGKTRLVALEPQSRNIAIRRSNPDNRWILSTNTDMIFCPNNTEQSLSAIVGALEDGFYHLPRFEVPEGFWERLSRTDPVAAIAAMRETGERFHLNEVVYGSYDNLYEAPGDFQLFLRQDLYDIRGFDERMILGWHADSNMARRMKLLRGEVKTVFPQLLGYHCGHTRQATSLHGGDRTQNNSDFFVRDVDDPVAPDQNDTWGAPDFPIEDIRLDRDDRYFIAMSAAVKDSGPAFSEAAYNDDSLNAVSYDVGHVLPQLCDILFNLPSGQAIFFSGDHVELLEGVRNFLEQAGKAPRFLLNPFAKCPDPDLLDPGRWGSCLVSLEDALTQADLILIQYPRGDEPAEDRREREWWHHRLLSCITQMEREKPKTHRRRIVVVNGIHNALAPLVESVLAPSTMPFSSRLRQGFVIDDAMGGGENLSTTAEWPIYQRLARNLPFTPDDRELLKRIFLGLRLGRPPQGWERLAPEVAAVCIAPPSARESFGVAGDEARIWGDMADEAMRAILERLVEQPAMVGPRAQIGNRLCSGDDWNDINWLGLAIAYFGPGVISFAERKRWMWERASLIDAVRRNIPLALPDMAGASGTRRLLVAADSPEPIAPILVHMGYDVTYATTAELAAGKSESDWTAQPDLAWLSLPPALHSLDLAIDPHPFDALIVTKPSLFEKSFDEVEAVLAAANPMMNRGALFFCAATVQLNDRAFAGGFSFAEWKMLYEPEGPLGIRGFEAVGGIDTRVPLDTAVRFALQDDPQETVYGLSHGLVNSYATSVLLTARWPSELRPGSQERLPWIGEPIDPSETLIPYGPRRAEVDSVRTTRRLGGIDLASRAFRAIETTPVEITSRARNVLPFALTEGSGLALPTSLILPVEDSDRGLGPWFALCLAAGDANRVVIQAEDANGGVLNKGESLIYGAGPSPVVIDGEQAVLTRDGPLGTVSVALRLSGGEARLIKLMAWVEP